MSDLSYDEKMAEWNRLANTVWLFMSADDIKSSQEAIRELLTRDAQWVEKWKAALDLLDTPLARIASLEARLEMATSDSETYDYRRGLAAGALSMQARLAGLLARCRGAMWGTHNWVSPLRTEVDAALAEYAGETGTGA